MNLPEATTDAYGQTFTVEIATISRRRFAVCSRHVEHAVHPVPQRIALERLEGDLRERLLEAEAVVDGELHFGFERGEVVDAEVEHIDAHGPIVARHDDRGGRQRGLYGGERLADLVHVAVEQPRDRRRLGDDRVAISGPMISNSGRALVDAASHGLGVAFVPDFHCARRLAAGELVRVLPQWRGEVPIQAVYPSARMMPINVRVFIDHLVEQMRRPAWLDLVPDA